jgi:3-hydroxyacyl-CoA dehydrogenase/enoyl-CoA hydratase/3-hydroxybutyryl-CoA epimerase
MDTIGLDVCHHIIAYLASHYGERLQEAALLSALVEEGRLGRKSGGGFYEYPSGKPSRDVDALVAGLRAEGRAGDAGSAFGAERLMALLINEAFLCLQEGIAAAEDIDLACVAGLGMQVRVGDELVLMGPLAYADQLGRDVLREQFRALETRHGRRFRPASILTRRGES